MAFKVVIAGGREFTNLSLLEFKCNNILKGRRDVEIVSGGARGADRLGEAYALKNNFKITQFLPDWNLYGKRAGILRNDEMARYADAVIVFWDGKSKGTKHMISMAYKYNLPIRIIRYEKI